MPFVVIDWIVVHSQRCVEGLSAIRAPGEHDIAPVAGSGRENAGDHIEVAVGRGAGTIGGEKDLPAQTIGIDCSAKDDAAAEIDLGALVEGGSDTAVPGITGADTPE